MSDAGMGSRPSQSDSSSASGSRPSQSDSSSASGSRPSQSDSSSASGSRPKKGNPRRRRLPDPPDPDDPTRAVDPKPLAGLLEGLVSRRGWAKRLSGARVHGRWAEIAGEDLARHTEPVRLHGGVLVVRVDSATWATQVRYLTGQLTSRANEVLGAGSVQRITLVTGPLQGTAD